MEIPATVVTEMECIELHQELESVDVMWNVHRARTGALWEGCERAAYACLAGWMARSDDNLWRGLEVTRSMKDIETCEPLSACPSMAGKIKIL